MLSRDQEPPESIRIWLEKRLEEHMRAEKVANAFDEIFSNVFQRYQVSIRSTCHFRPNMNAGVALKRTSNLITCQI